MLINLIFIELKKCKRTIMPWLIIAGGLLTSGTAMLLVTTENKQVSWNTFASTGLNCMNLLALLLVAVITGFVFAGEYNENMDNILFTYPVPRIKIFISKSIVLLLLTISLYLTFSLFAMLFGLINIGDFPSLSFCLKLLKVSLILSAIHFVLVPITTLISILIKGAGTYIFVGMAYIMLYMSFIKSAYNKFIPVCIPDLLVTDYYVSEIFDKSSFFSMALTCLFTFIAVFLIAVVYYSKRDIYQ